MSLSSRSITTNPDGIAAYVKMPQKVVILQSPHREIVPVS